jgi:hypothetical protein
MHQYRAVLARLRQGDSDRDIARARLMGRNKLARFRALAAQQGWLQPESALPDDATIAAVLGVARRARSTISSVEPHRALVEHWAAQGVSGVVIHGLLCREHGYTGSASSVYRMLDRIAASRAPDATVPLHFAPGEAAQVDFGAGPLLPDPASGQPRRTWCFVMTLCFSRHLRVVCRRPRAPHHRQPQVRDHPRMCLRPAGAACLCRVRRGLRLQDRPLPPARPGQEGHRGGGSEVREAQLPAHPQLPRSGRSQCPGARLGDAAGRAARARHHARAAAAALRARGRSSAARGTRLLRARPRLVHRAGWRDRAGLRRAHRAAARRPHNPATTPRCSRDSAPTTTLP